ncbi:MAG: hypothetical protein WAT46_18330, partial [Saprospiraceae bacterium]
IKRDAIGTEGTQCGEAHGCGKDECVGPYWSKIFNLKFMAGICRNRIYVNLPTPDSASWQLVLYLTITTLSNSGKF